MFVESLNTYSKWIEKLEYVIKTKASDESIRLTGPGCVREVDLCDESVSVRSRFSEVSRFRVDQVTLTVWIQNLQTQRETALMSHYIFLAPY